MKWCALILLFAASLFVASPGYSISRIDAISQLQSEFLSIESRVSNPIHKPVLALIENRESECVALILHGLYESPDAIKGIRNYFQSRNCDVVVPLLPGHWMKNKKEAYSVGHLDWVRHVEKVFALTKALHAKRFLVGFSFGGLLAYRLAQQHPEDIDQLLLISPALALSDKVYVMSSISQLFCLSKNTYTGDKYDGIDVDHYPGYWGNEVFNTIEDTFSIRRGEPWSRVKELKKSSYGLLRVPTFVAYTLDDETVSPQEIAELVRSSPAVKKVRVYPMGSGIKHGNISRSEIDIKPTDPRGWKNSRFDEFLNDLADFFGATKALK